MAGQDKTRNPYQKGAEVRQGRARHGGAGPGLAGRGLARQDKEPLSEGG